MWYVNATNLLSASYSIVSFILTMWYVNLGQAYLIPYGKQVFYINYVICKFNTVSASFLLLVGFILTMWYVNDWIKLKKN